MENQETPEQQRIKELEARVYMLEGEKTDLQLINIKLGYSVRLMNEFHLTQDDKANIANSIDMANSAEQVQEVYNQYHKLLHNKALSEGLEEFQMSQDFKDNLLNYLSVAMGKNPIVEIEDNVIKLKAYFDLENKIRSTPNAGERQALTEKLLNSRTGTIEALNAIIDSINNFYKEES
jgi:hypothetical protein